MSCGDFLASQIDNLITRKIFQWLPKVWRRQRTARAGKNIWSRSLQAKGFPAGLTGEGRGWGVLFESGTAAWCGVLRVIVL